MDGHDGFNSPCFISIILDLAYSVDWNDVNYLRIALYDNKDQWNCALPFGNPRFHAHRFYLDEILKVILGISFLLVRPYTRGVGSTLKRLSLYFPFML